MLRKYYQAFALAILSLLLCVACGNEQLAKEGTRGDLGVEPGTSTTDTQSILGSSVGCSVNGPSTVVSGQIFSVTVTISGGTAPYGVQNFVTNSSTAANNFNLQFFNNTSNSSISAGGKFYVTATVNGIAVLGSCAYSVNVTK